MEEFAIQGDGGDFLRLRFIEVYGFPNSISDWGGYEVEAAIKVKSGNYRVASTLRLSTGLIYAFFSDLSNGNEQLSGEVLLNTPTLEGNLELVMRYDMDGRISVSGKLREFIAFENELRFEFGTDQTYIQSTITELKKITAKYGGMEGIKV